MDRFLSLLFSLTFLGLAALAFAACRDDNSGATVDTDTNTDSDSDGATVDTDSGGPALTDAYFVSDTVRLATLEESCDLTGDGKNDNALLKLINSLSAQYGLAPADETFAEAIANGDLLSVWGVHGVDSFDADDDVTLNIYSGTLGDAGAGVPDDLFSGQGSIGLDNGGAPNATISGSFDKGTLVADKVEKLTIAVPVGDELVLVDVEQAQVFASIEPYPDAEMLHGKMPEGKICGAIAAKKLIEVAQAIPDLPAILRPLVPALINSAADMKCNGAKCFSLAMIFSAVSVKKK